jgi:hypothetical protein
MAVDGANFPWCGGGGGNQDAAKKKREDFHIVSMQALRVRKTQLSVLGEGETGRLKDSRGTAETGRRGDQQTTALAIAGQIARTKGISHG